MTKRLKYTKDILTHMLNNNAGNTGGGSTNTNRMGTAVSSKRSGMSA